MCTIVQTYVRQCVDDPWSRRVRQLGHRYKLVSGFNQCFCAISSPSTLGDNGRRDSLSLKSGVSVHSTNSQMSGG